MVSPIKNEQEYELAVNRVYTLMQKNLKPGSKETIELEELSKKIEKFEAKYFANKHKQEHDTSNGFPFQLL